MASFRTMILAAAGVMLLSLPQAAAAQWPAQVPPEAERDQEIYHLRPERHGISYFPRARHPQVQYEATDALTFDRYHTVDVMYDWLYRWAEQHPGIVELYEVGRSYEGRPILQMTLTNRSTGPKEEKPAAFFEGGRHSGEITSSESVLWLAQHLIDNYGTDPEITHLLDTKAITLRVQNNPDGSNMYLHTAVMNRSTVRPIDNDGDGLLDDDEADDINGDGVVTQMRWRPSMTGADTIAPTMVEDERDPRLLRRARDGETPVWRVMGEGVDNDGDGRFNEDGIGGLDLHRNYPENWRPEPGGDATGRGYTQFGAGEFPLSEPETRSVVLWLFANPNVSVVNSMDTRVPMHLRPPSTSKSEERMYPEDLAHYLHFDSVGLSITEYPWAGDVYHTYATRNNPDREGSPLFGHGPDFGYFQYGSIWYGDELWDGGAVGDVDGDGETDQYDQLLWIDRETNGDAFIDWTPAHHPEFGEVEVGGMHPKFFSQNGPPEVLERWASRQALFNLEMAKSLPELEWQDVNVRRVAQHGADSTTYEVQVEWRNNGRLPTALEQAKLVKIVQEDRLRLNFPDAEGARAPRITAPDLRGGAVYAGWTEGGETKTVTYTVTTYGSEPVTAELQLDSTRGGVLRRTIELGG